MNGAPKDSDGNLEGSKKGFSLDKIAKEALETPNDQIPANDNFIKEEEIGKIVNGLAETHGISAKQALIGIMLLFLKGSASPGTPDSLRVTPSFPVDDKLTSIVITKNDLLFHYNRVMGNKYLRRLAETLRDPISIFAQKYGLRGDLAQKVNNLLIAKGKNPLTPKQKAWCSSFNSNNPALETDPELFVVANAIAYTFLKQTDSPSKNKKNSSPRKKGPGPKGPEKAKQNQKKYKAQNNKSAKRKNKEADNGREY